MTNLAPICSEHLLLRVHDGDADVPRACVVCGQPTTRCEDPSELVSANE
jgi:hypothetical protein